MKSESKSILGSSEKSKLRTNSSTSSVNGDDIRIESQNSVNSPADVISNNPEEQHAKSSESEHLSPQKFGELAISLHNSVELHIKSAESRMTSMESRMASMESRMESHTKFMQNALKQVIDNQTVMRQEFKESLGVVQSDIKEIKHDLHDSNGHLANSIKESEERIVTAVERLIARSEEVTRAKTAEEISKNNVSLLTKTAGIGLVIGGAVIAFGKWLFDSYIAR